MEKGRNDMNGYINKKALLEFAQNHKDGQIDANDIARFPCADVVPKSEVAELLRLMFNDDCACNYNGNDEWLPFKCKYALTDCPTPPERLGCWMEFVEYGLAELKKKYTEN
jgi:hypothetical protein